MQSRQKPLQSCLIKANQGKRQIRESSCWMGRTGVRMPNLVPGKNSLLGERKQVRESVPPTGQAASSCLSDPGHPDLRNPRPAPDFAPIKAKTPAIKANQASSRHPLKKHKMGINHQPVWNRNDGGARPAPSPFSAPSRKIPRALKGIATGCVSPAPDAGHAGAPGSARGRACSPIPLTLKRRLPLIRRPTIMLI